MAWEILILFLAWETVLGRTVGIIFVLRTGDYYLEVTLRRMINMEPFDISIVWSTWEMFKIACTENVYRVEAAQEVCLW